ncbi:MAG: hypothetical protein PHW10_00655 [Candidatus Peribacteraceae bacterium]|nr:hypothetical protein [Candidatus Peribacteraceae bacterium]
MASTQRFLPIAEIHHDTVVLKNGGLRAVLQVEAINFNLKSETEQQGIIAGYQSFVNTLDFPLQIVIRSSRMNIDPYLNNLRGLAENQKNDLLKEQTLAYADFIERLVDVADIMQKRFFVVVPMDMSGSQKSLLEQFFRWLSIDDTPGKIAQRHREFGTGNTKLKDRVTLVQTGLQNIGLASHRLSTRELIELYYQIYNPKTSQEQKLPADEQLHVDQTVL